MTAKVEIWRVDFEETLSRSQFYSFVAAGSEEEARTEAEKHLFDGDRITSISGPVQGDPRKAMNR